MRFAPDNFIWTKLMKSQGNDPRFPVFIADEGLNFKKHVFDDPKVLGRQLIEAVGGHPVDEHVAIAILPNGDFEDIRLDESYDLRGRGAAWHCARLFGPCPFLSRAQSCSQEDIAHCHRPVIDFVDEIIRSSACGPNTSATAAHSVLSFAAVPVPCALI